MKRLSIFALLVCWAAIFASALADDGGSPQVTFQLGHAQKVGALAFSADGHVLWSAGESSHKLWDLETGRLLRTLPVRDGIFSPDRRLTLRKVGDELDLWNLEAGKRLKSLEGHTGNVETAVFSAGGGRVLSGGEDHTVRLWDAASGRLLRTFEGHAGSVSWVGLSRDGDRALSGGEDDAARLWDVESGQLLQMFEGHKGVAVAGAFSPDGRHIVIGGAHMALLDVQNGRVIREFEGSGQAETVVISPDGRLALTSGGDEAAVKLWDIDTGKLVRAFAGLKRSASELAFSPDGREAIAGSKDGRLARWEVASGKLLGQCGYFINAVLTPDGERFAAANWDGAVELRSARSGELLVTFLREGNDDGLVITPAGFFEASGGGGKLVHAVWGREVAVSDALRGRLHRPDLVAEALKGDPEGRHNRAATELDIRSYFHNRASVAGEQRAPQ